jgi:digeranylgeranylglycerophospholipid reductase
VAIQSDYTVVGAGPAGIATSINLSKHGYNVTLLEAAPRLALKPCGWGIPLPGTLPFKLPEEAVLKYIDGASLYVDGKHALDYTGNNLGVIVDKRVMLEKLAIEHGLEIRYKSPVTPSKLKQLSCNGKLVMATGVPWYRGETINAVQLHLRTDVSWGEMFEFYFDSDIIGYYWVFPLDRNKVKVGVGGFRDAKTLRRLLGKFIKNDNRIRDATPISPLEGAKLAVGGIILPENPEKVVAVGEAIGTVFPLTGEGIRPSMITGFEVGEALAEGKDPFRAIRKSDVYWKVSLQRRILEGVKKLAPESRAEFLRSLNPEVIIRVGLGDFSRASLLRLALKSPSSLSKILKSFI